MAEKRQPLVLRSSSPSSPAKASELLVYRPPSSPLPDQRPIADNSTEDVNELMGFLD